MAITIDSKEVEQSIAELLNGGLDARIKGAMYRACLYVEGEAKRLCPVDDGQLRQSITHDVEVSASGVTGYVGTNVEYAPYVHQGTGVYSSDGGGRQTAWVYRTAEGKFYKTKGQKPKPFLKQAMLKSKNNIAEYFKGIL